MACVLVAEPPRSAMWLAASNKQQASGDAAYLPSVAAMRYNVRLHNGRGLSMKWREPWLLGLRHQPRFNPFHWGVLKTALGVSGSFAVLGAVTLLTRERSASDIALSLAICVGMGPAIALLAYTLNWLSPRKIDHGPNGIVINKGESILLLPWQAIASYGFVTVEGEGALSLRDHAGVDHRVFLSDRISRTVIERTLREHTGLVPGLPR
ncbi:TPA: hypothetical protein QDZ42_002259 [Stenotrophomonas maltophilia]|nr:hypothetical protein [Stenotrophomonas maltophilia]HDS1043595.1 hypothetical protein [Stenotrophomonas maltophilia]